MVFICPPIYVNYTVVVVRSYTRLLVYNSQTLFFSKIISSSLTFFFSTSSADDSVCFSAANCDIVINENALHSRTL